VRFLLTHYRGMTQLDKYLRNSATTAKALAEMVGVSAPYITDLRYARRKPSNDVARRIAEATGGEVPADGWPSMQRGAA
jgi:transcriptional regulator with XRE-family HTH domain